VHDFLTVASFLLRINPGHEAPANPANLATLLRKRDVKGDGQRLFSLTKTTRPEPLAA
jgi:hypothetical protein